MNFNYKASCYDGYECFDEDKFHDECGVYGIFTRSEDVNVAKRTYYGLYALQHRGQESAGIATFDGSDINCHKNMGLVSEVFNKAALDSMTGYSAIGHVRYSTAGDSTLKNAQPIVGRCKLGNIALAHNGNLTNADIIRELLAESGCVFQTTIDTEVIINLISRGAAKGIVPSIIDSLQAIKGSFAIVILTENELIGIRDPYGIRPLCLGTIDGGYVLASESCALNATGAEYVRDIKPGEVVIINDEGVKSFMFGEKSKPAPCSFEYIYFARPDSVIDGISVNSFRYKAGMRLYDVAPVEADIVVGVPDSGLSAAMGYAKASGIPMDMAIIKNKYIGRTFIAPTQEERQASVDVKLNVIRENVMGKRVVLIDDSIVRGTTSKRLVAILKAAGAKEVHFRVCSPMVVYPCYYGIDIPYRSELIASKMNEKEIGEFIGADSLVYLDKDNLHDCLGREHDFCFGCFDGEYPISAPVNHREE